MSFLKRFISNFRPYFSSDILAVAILGFSSGLPIMMTLSTLTFWLAKYDVDIKTIGLMSLLGLPYIFKFLWAPFLDYARLPFIARFGRRKSWILLFQALLVLVFLGLSSVNPKDHIILVCILILCLAFLSASQDIVIDAFRIDYLTNEQQAFGVSAAQATYRIATLLMGAGIMILSDHINWSSIFLVVALLMALLLLITLFIKEPDTGDLVMSKKNEKNKNIYEEIVVPFVDLFKKNQALLFIIFIICFKLPDAVSGVMMSKFYVEMNYTGTQIGGVTKIYGTIASFVGVFVLGVIIKTVGIYRALFITVILVGVTNLFYLLVLHSPTVLSLIIAITFENSVNGFSGALLVTFLSILCNKEYSATQYALLSSLAAVGVRTVGGGSGYMVNYLGWSNFFIMTTLLFIPALIFLIIIKKEVEKM